MKKILDINTQLTDFDDVALKAADDELLTMKVALLHYIQNAHLMGLSGNEEMTLYFIGRQFKGAVNGKIKLDMNEYKLLQKIAENGKIDQAGQKLPLFGLVAAQQIRILLEEAPTEKDK